MAYRPCPRIAAPGTFNDQLERELIFLGLAAMKDPLRPEAKAAVQLCRDAGIRTVMITGDHKDTAVAIAREVADGGEGAALSGSELDTFTDQQLVERVDSLTVYAPRVGRAQTAHCAGLEKREVPSWR